MSRKRPQIVEYVPSSSVPTVAGAITLHHTHYEPRRRPVKSVVTLDAPDEHVEVADTLLTDPSVPPAPLDDDGIEEVECEGQELEIHGLGVHNPEASFGKDIPVEGGRRRRRTQGVGITFFQKNQADGVIGSSSP
jgi:hypothetical protein